MRPPSQTSRVLTALKNAGARGITQHDFDAGSVIDGGGEIKQIARRIYDLRMEWDIASCGMRDGVEVYALVGKLQPPPPTEPIPTRDGVWVIWHNCERCQGKVARAHQACGRTTATLMSPINEPLRGCRLKERQAEIAVQRARGLHGGLRGRRAA